MTQTNAVVLLGEPDLPTCELYQRTLHRSYQVVVALDEEAVMRALLVHPVTILVLEPAIFLARPWERLRAVGQICAEREIALVICSTRDERRRGIALGATRYLVKPTLPSTLLLALQQLSTCRRN